MAFSKEYDARLATLERERHFMNMAMLNQEEIPNWRINDLIHNARLLAQELEKEAESLRAMAEIYEKMRG